MDRVAIEQEMTYVGWQDSCRDPFLTLDFEFRECRRMRGHTDNHTSGFGENFRTWANTPG